MRVINKILRQDESTTVPTEKQWNVSIFGETELSRCSFILNDYNKPIEISNQDGSSKNLRVSIKSGTKIKVHSNSNVAISGIELDTINNNSVFTALYSGELFVVPQGKIFVGQVMGAEPGASIRINGSQFIFNFSRRIVDMTLTPGDKLEITTTQGILFIGEFIDESELV